MSEEFRYIFGPVPSRRLGRSLGVDIVPFKTCTYDCIYCQLGRTTRKTVERSSYVPVEGVLAELRRCLSGGASPDYITISGSGEPTLNVDLGEIIDGIKAMTDIPVAVLTNGSLLWMDEVRKSLLRADVVAPSLDAGTPDTFERVDRPHGAIGFERMLEGLIAFRQEYAGGLWLEIFLVDGMNDSDEEIARIVELVGRIKPDRVQINTVARPPSEAASRPLKRERLDEIAGRFMPTAEVIADIPAGGSEGQGGSADDIERMCRRRPCTLEDISRGLGINPNEVSKYLEQLQRRGLIRARQLEGRTYFIAGV